MIVSLRFCRIHCQVSYTDVNLCFLQSRKLFLASRPPFSHYRNSSLPKSFSSLPSPSTLPRPLQSISHLSSSLLMEDPIRQLRMNGSFRRRQWHSPDLELHSSTTLVPWDSVKTLSMLSHPSWVYSKSTLLSLRNITSTRYLSQVAPRGSVFTPVVHTEVGSVLI